MNLVIIPAFNEEFTIGNIIRTSLEYVDKIIVCDDGSTDRTAHIARKNGATVISHRENFGYGAALLTLFEKAKEEKANVTITMDGDGQHDPKQIPIFLRAIKEKNLDVVIGSRFLRKESNTSTFRRSGIKIITSASNMGTKFKISDSQSGFRAYSKKAIEKINLSETGMAVSTEILQKISKNNLSVGEVPITVSYKGKTSSKNTLSHGIGVLMNTLKIISVKHPILAYGIPGIILFVAGIITGYFFLENYLNSDELFLGSLFGSVVLIVVGVVLIATSVILFSLANLLNERK